MVARTCGEKVARSPGSKPAGWTGGNWRKGGGGGEGLQTASALGISWPTVESHLSALEITQALTLVRPFHGGGQGELVRQPKAYAFDTGFVSFSRGWGIRCVRPTRDCCGSIWWWRRSRRSGPVKPCATGATRPDARRISCVRATARRWTPTSARPEGRTLPVVMRLNATWYGPIRTDPARITRSIRDNQRYPRDLVARSVLRGEAGIGLEEFHDVGLLFLAETQTEGEALGGFGDVDSGELGLAARGQEKVA